MGSPRGRGASSGSDAGPGGSRVPHEPVELALSVPATDLPERDHLLGAIRAGRPDDRLWRLLGRPPHRDLLHPRRRTHVTLSLPPLGRHPLDLLGGRDGGFPEPSLYGWLPDDRDAGAGSPGRGRPPRGPGERPGRRLVARRKRLGRFAAAWEGAAGWSIRSAACSSRRPAGSATSASRRTAGWLPSSTTPRSGTARQRSGSWTTTESRGSPAPAALPAGDSPGRPKATRSGRARLFRRSPSRAGLGFHGLSWESWTRSTTSPAAGASSSPGRRRGARSSVRPREARSET